jgi:type II secretory pathway component PulC
VAAPQKGPEVNLKVTGIVQGPRSYYALVESESPTGTGFVIRENDVVDSARVLKITKEYVIFEVETKSREGKPLTRRVQKHIGL